MPEQAKIDTTFIASMTAAEKIPQAKRLTATVKHPVRPHTVFEVYALIPATDDEAKERYDCNLADIIEMGVRQMTYRPSYRDVMFKDTEKTIAKSDDDISKEVQSLLDGYTVGRKAATSGSVKAKAKQFDALASKAAEKGYSAEELDDIIAKAKAKAK